MGGVDSSKRTPNVTLEQTTGVYLLAPEHATALQILASDPAIAATTRVPHPYPPDGARQFIEQQAGERAEGRAYVFVIKDRNEVVGVCGIHGVANDEARELGYWIGRPYWGQGYATFGVKKVLQFAFQNLRLTRVGSEALESNMVSRRVLAKSGFRLLRVEKHNDSFLKRPDEKLAVYEITRSQWLESRNGPVIAQLHPALKLILEAELNAGNEILEISDGGTNSEGVLFIKLRHRFRVPPGPLSSGIVYSEPNDPHWWFADYSAANPRQNLAC